MTSHSPAPMDVQKYISGHCHVHPNLSGIKARCGGPALCLECAKELAATRFSTTTLPMEANNEGYSTEHEARVAASYHSIHTPEGHAFFHDCCGSLRVRIDDPTQSDMRALLYFTTDQARQLRDKLNEWFPSEPVSIPSTDGDPGSKESEKVDVSRSEIPELMPAYIPPEIRLCIKWAFMRVRDDAATHLEKSIVWLFKYLGTLEARSANVTAKVEEAVRKEREACAKIAEDERDIESDHENHSGGVGSAACQRIAERIRSRFSEVTR